MKRDTIDSLEDWRDDGSTRGMEKESGRQKRKMRSKLVIASASTHVRRTEGQLLERQERKQ